MADEDEKAREDAARKDAEETARWDKMFGAVDALCKRMDAYEEEKKADKARKDAEEKAEEEEKAKADAARKDEEETKAEEKEEAKADSRKDSDDEENKRLDAALAAKDEQIKSLAERLEKLAARQDAVFTHLSRNENESGFGEFQARADAVFMTLDKRARPPMPAESLLDYRRSLLADLQAHSKDYKGKDLKALSADFLDLAEAKIFADAQAAARDPSRVPPGKLHCITRKDEAGHTIREYAGSMSDYLAMHTGLPPKIAKFRRPAA